MNDAKLRLVRRGLGADRAERPRAVLLLFHDQPPDAREEARDALDAGHRPRLRGLQRPHEHEVAAQSIRAVFGDDVVRVDDVAAALAHLLAVLAEDESLIHEPLERLGRGDVAEVVQHLVPKPFVEQMQHGVLGAADIQIHAAGLWGKG